MSISDNIKFLRESHKLSQVEFGLIAGVTNKAVSAWEKGKKIPRMGAIQNIADHFGLKKSDIIEDNLIKNLSEDFAEEVNTTQSEAYILTDKEKHIIDTVRTLNDNGVEYVVRQLKFAVEQPDYKKGSDLSTKEA